MADRVSFGFWLDSSRSFVQGLETPGVGFTSIMPTSFDSQPREDEIGSDPGLGRWEAVLPALALKRLARDQDLAPGITLPPTSLIPLTKVVTLPSMSPRTLRQARQHSIRYPIGAWTCPGPLQTVSGLIKGIYLARQHAHVDADEQKNISPSRASRY